MKYHIVTFLIGAITAVSAMLLAQPHDPMSQTTFPCQEDEVLGYSPRFGPDDVGCIHYEEGLR